MLPLVIGLLTAVVRVCGPQVMTQHELNKLFLGHQFRLHRRYARYMNQVCAFCPVRASSVAMRPADAVQHGSRLACVIVCRWLHV